MSRTEVLDQKIRLLVVELVDSAPPAPPLPDPSAQSQRLSLKRRQWARRSLTTVLAVAAVIVAVLVPVLGHGALPPKWVLVGEVGSSWHEVPSSGLTSGFSLTCPNSTTCYAEGPSNVEVTTDGGKAWQHQVIGLGIAVSPVTCVGSDFCAVLSVSSSGKPLFDRTTDGGRTWSQRPGPSVLASFYQGRGKVMILTGPVDMSCATATDCVIVALAPQLASTGAFVTRDGGLTWSVSNMPQGILAVQVECFTGGRCVAAGEAGAAYSTDSGLSWSTARTGPGYGGPTLSLACSGALDCTVMFPSTSEPGQPVSVVISRDGGRSWPATMARGLPTGKVFTSLSCPTKWDCWAAGNSISSTGGLMFPGTGGVLGSTTNGAESWRDARLPPGVGGVWAVSCPGLNVCFALASTASVPSTSTPTGPPTSFVLLAYGSRN